MMLQWMAYATLAGALLAAAGTLLERFSPWLTGNRRVLWLGVIGATLAFAAAVVIPPRQSPGDALSPTGARERSTSASALPSAPMPIAAERGAIAPASVQIGRPQPSPSQRIESRTDELDVLLIVVWLVGTALCLSMLTMSAWRVALMRRTWRESVLAGVPVFVSHDVGPAVIGLVHHGIVVPAWIESLDVDAQRTVMTHEREHVRAGDPLLLWGATLLVAIAPWNVALWYALRRLRHAIEIDCDARVLRSRPDTRAYCTLLLNVGERTLAGVAPVAALAEPATLLERRIEAMLEPMRVRRGGVLGSAVAALALVAAACFTPRPEVAPRARVAALVTELNSLLSRDSVRKSLSPDDRSRISQALAGAVDGAAKVADAEGKAASTAPESSSADSKSGEFGSRVVQLARDSFPEAFQKRDDAFVVMTVYDADHHVMRNYARRFRLEEVFDVLPGVKDSIVGMRNDSYIVSRVVPGWKSHLTQSGMQRDSEFPHAIFMWGVLIPGEVPPAPQDRQPRHSGVIEPSGGEREVIGQPMADSIARSLYPATYAPHTGIPVVGLIFSADGKVLGHGMRHASHDEVFVPVHDTVPPQGEFARSGEELLSVVFTGVPAKAGRWSTVAHRSTSGPALVWTILPDDGHLPVARTDSEKPVLVGRTVSSAHRQVQVTLSADKFRGRRVRVYSTGMNLVEAGDVGGVRDPIEVGLPTTMTFDLGSEGAIHFVSEDGRPFTVSAWIGGGLAQLSASGAHIQLDGQRGAVVAVK